MREGTARAWEGGHGARPTSKDADGVEVPGVGTLGYLPGRASPLRPQCHHLSWGGSLRTLPAQKDAAWDSAHVTSHLGRTGAGSGVQGHIPAAQLPL